MIGIGLRIEPTGLGGFIISSESLRRGDRLGLTVKARTLMLFERDV
ncbi:hypothetical protein H072_304 [Dactylellina haptotyla CBS 200.50]|uniref:Uncharacterized protein n=1 Tax=Dactylellina haptotyla (strain CBS 200.50) TaxID=1284197 RepID=S8ASH2_DACHA|nr:hypothetical protein H072_304 [Dactylellina haptotyla CBS 200.50]